MTMKVLAIVFLSVALELATAQVNYCNIRGCANRASHTICRFPTPGPSSSCTGLINTGLTTNEQQRILNLHNQLRQKVATGTETRGSPGPLPAASDMTTMVWNNELAKLAQRWADQCQKAIDSCRNTQQYYVNQNFGYSGTTGNVNTITVESIVQSWYDQVDSLNRAAIDNFTGAGANDDGIGSVSQILWSSSNNLGCGAIRYKDGRFNTLLLVCNYGPGGNVIGDYIYQAI